MNKPINFSRDGGYVQRELFLSGKTFIERVRSHRENMEPEKDFFVSYLSSKLEYPKTPKKKLTFIDLFCGGGGLSLGVHNASKFLGYNPKLVAAADIDANGLKLVSSHFSPLYARAQSVENLIDYEISSLNNTNDFAAGPRFKDSQIAQLKGQVDLLVGGPPCQGHSNLNNRTRGSDPRNLLYLVMPAFAVGLDIPMVIIENVLPIRRSRENVVEIAKNIFKHHGYFVEECILNAKELGVAQTRKRHFMIAKKTSKPNLAMMKCLFATSELSFLDICEKLPNLDNSFELIEGVPNLSKENKSRIQFLYDNDLYDLPNHMRPVCHQKGHTYQAVYGRIKADLPVSTITTGFSSPGRGRYIHPQEKRVINIREAGRIQGFPDWYWQNALEVNLKKMNYRKIIGEAVPPLMAYPLMAALYAH